MSLSKQLLLLISILFMMVFSVNFIIGVQNIRSYLEIESGIHAQDTATSLGLSLSPYIIDEKDPMMETMMNAIFDQGFYREIRLVNMEDKELVRLHNEKIFSEVPGWFSKLLPMETAMAETEVSSGWTINGKLQVTINPGYGYLKLYQQARSALYSSLLAFAVSLILLVLVLRLILKPLQRINQLALTIAEGRFDSIHPLPWTKEIHNVASSMNFMSKKLEGVISGLNTKLGNINQQLKTDTLTGLDIKSTLATDFKQIFMEKGGGFLFFVKIHELGIIAKNIGNNETDKFLKRFAKVLLGAADSDQKKHRCYRLFGAEFSMMAKGITSEDAGMLAEELKLGLSELGSEYDLAEVAHIGISPISSIGTPESNLAAAVEAYKKATLIGANAFHIRSGDDHVRDKQEWKGLVTDVIDNGDFEVAYIGQVYTLTAEKELIIEEAFTKVTDDAGEPVSIGTFISIAEEYNKVMDLDRKVVERVINHIESSEISHAIAVNLSMESLVSAEFQYWLEQYLSLHQSITGRLVFSVSSYAATRNIEGFKSFINFIHKLKSRVILKRFETQFIPLDQLNELKLDFIRLAREYSQDISVDHEKRSFVEAMKELCELLDITVIAEGVKEEADYEMLRQIGLAAASR